MSYSPHECRERELNYSAPLYATVKRVFDNDYGDQIKIKLGNIPIMVRSKFCNLHNKSIEELVSLKEDLHDFGGYFIINGLEKLIRMNAIARRNYPIAFLRPTLAKKIQGCSEYAVQMKCVREDLVSHTLWLHYINDGNCMLRLLIKKQELMIPLIIILKALIDCPDILIFNRVVRGNNKNTKLRECVEVLIAEGKKYGFSKRSNYLEYLGSRFRDLLNLTNINEVNNEQVGKMFLKEYILTHMHENNNDKFNMLCIMVEKLYLLAFGDIKPDNLDSPLNHEILLSGHLYIMVLKENLEGLLDNLKQRINKTLNRNTSKETKKIKDIQWIKKQIDSCIPISKKMEYFLATGNILSKTGLDLMQFGGFSILAERINNMRYISHFRAVHRGQFFTEMKTTQPRKLLPESWGFMCPVHTPDGSPCGLLLHISSGCEIISSPPVVDSVKFGLTLSSLGMIPVSYDLNFHIGNDTYPVILDGNLVGYINDYLVKNFVNGLRKYKVLKTKNVPETLEIGFIPKSVYNVSLQYPGIFLFTCIARMVRKVKNLSLNQEEYIGPLEQIYLDIACLPEDIRSETTHQEIDPNKILSLVASLTPFCDYNQSPRNMYQCQMGKQTMGTPFYNYPYRVDNKTYRILFPQNPLVRTTTYESFGFDSNPSGTNAVVAVLSYTGYDMEDAMIINKSSYERGLGHGIVYKSKTKKINEHVRGMKDIKGTQRLLDTKLYPEDIQMVKAKLRKDFPKHIGSDGIPFPGTMMTQHMEEFIYFDTKKNTVVINYYKDSEPSIIDQVRVYGDQNQNGDEISVNFTYRYNRKPVIGDKFSSRHGQKGVLSNLWPQENMPFTESGISPDIIINPHAFPSRMTIGMLIESLAGKSGSLNGKFQEFSTFQQFEDDDVIGHFGKELLDRGYNYYGNEIMYSGVSGLQLKAEIFIGVVYYQRLRHMVNDKAQARATGQIDVLTRQPVKGRKNQGGIRFGEMERDSLLSHGISYCLHDRLFNCSDYSEGYICSKCGELLATLHFKEAIRTTGTIFDFKSKEGNNSGEIKSKRENDNFFDNTKVICRNCETDNTSVKVAIPYVLRYLTNELAAMNIRMSFAIK